MLRFLCIIFIIELCNGEYYIGAGINDITGPAAEVNFMGYANPKQIGHGIHMRLYSRAFIFMNPSNDTRFVFVSVDCGMISQIVKTRVIKDLHSIYGDLYTERNVALSSTHSHSGPAGFHQYILFDITSMGFVNETYIAMTTGIVKSIVKAHKSIRKGRIFMNSGELLGANINRSPTSYLANPDNERKRYQYDVDKEMTVLRLVEMDGRKEIGMISWFPVHGTSMNNTNELISSDNKGYASMLFERLKNNNTRPGQGSFVAAFAQANLGDVSPNINGARCVDTGRPCDNYTSTCGGRNEKCIAFGPGKDMFESTKIIGERQFRAAVQLFEKASVELRGHIQYIHQFKQMTNLEIKLADGTWGQTCLPAMGYSFAAGTTDGPGAFDFTQGSKSSNPFWNILVDLIKKPSEQLIKCQAPKPILLATGEINFPNIWQPQIVETQVLRIGQLLIAAVPGELTTMSGRRMRDTIRKVMAEEKPRENVTVVIAGLSNTYSDYIATFEEYQRQRYEAASTIYGPHTLEAHLSQYSNLTRSMIRNETIAPGPIPPFIEDVIGFVPPVIFDYTGYKKSFGEVLIQPNSTISRNSVASVTFVAANPRNEPQSISSFLYVERFSNSTWITEFTDADWETKFIWSRKNIIAILFGESEVVVKWEIPSSQKPGLYRIRYQGISKTLFARFKRFQGISNSFNVV